MEKFGDECRREYGDEVYEGGREWNNTNAVSGEILKNIRNFNYLKVATAVNKGVESDVSN